MEKVVLIHFPKKLAQDDNLTRIRNIAQLTDRVNEKIKSRENYRINNQAMDNFSRRMKIYDDELILDIDPLLIATDEIKPTFE